MLLLATTSRSAAWLSNISAGAGQETALRGANCRHECPMVSSTDAGSSAARLARSVRDAEVGGSNPLSPTAPGVALRRSRFSLLIFGFACDVQRRSHLEGRCDRRGSPFRARRQLRRRAIAGDSPCLVDRDRGEAAG